MWIVIMIEIDVLEVHFNVLEESEILFMPKRGDIYDSEELRLFDFGPEKTGEIKMTQVIDSPLHFSPFFGNLSDRNPHYPCVVDQIVYFFTL